MNTDRLNAAAALMAFRLAGDPAARFTAAKQAWSDLSMLEAAAPEPSAPERVEPTDEEWRKAVEGIRVKTPYWMLARDGSREAYRLAALRSEAATKATEVQP